MENYNKKTKAENQKLNSQINASATKNNLFSADGSAVGSKEDKRRKLVVFNEHTLGFIDPEFPLTVQVLHSSVLRGAIGTTMRSSYHLNSTDRLRLASEKDFEDFRVHFGSFGNENEYIYQN